jgi:hypothetical protein
MVWLVGIVSWYYFNYCLLQPHKKQDKKLKEFTSASTTTADTTGYILSSRG